MSARGPKRRSLAERFWAKVDKNGPLHPVLLTRCWLWTACRDEAGYGKIGEGGRGGRSLRAHRVSWEIAHGALAEGEHVLHHCDNPPCENPAHLFKGTNLDNMKDRDAKGRAVNPVADAERAQTHCKHGHEFTPENTNVRPKGRRACRQCRRTRQHDWRAEHKRAA